MYTVSKTFYFNAAHRIQHHQGLCRNVHGHNYTCIVTCQSDTLDENAMVIDFKEMTAIKQWLDRFRDHAYIFEVGDEIGDFLRDKGMKIYELPLPPSTEVLAQHLFDYAQSINFPVSNIELRETPKCKATYTGKVL